jgi:hypothetical protein
MSSIQDARCLWVVFILFYLLVVNGTAAKPRMKSSVALFSLRCLGLLLVADSHTWLFSGSRASMQASLDKPFRALGDAVSGEHVHAQLGPQQTMVVRWASSHNNTFTFAVVSAKDEEWFFHPSFYAMLDDYIDSAPAGSNQAVQKPRYHGATRSSMYLDTSTNAICAGENCVKDLFTRKIATSENACKIHPRNTRLLRPWNDRVRVRVRPHEQKKLNFDVLDYTNRLFCLFAVHLLQILTPKKWESAVTMGTGIFGRTICMSTTQM